MLGNTRFISRVEHDISLVRCACTGEISCSTLEINLVFPRTHVLFSFLCNNHSTNNNFNNYNNSNHKLSNFAQIHVRLAYLFLYFIQNHADLDKHIYTHTPCFSIGNGSGRPFNLVVQDLSANIIKIVHT